MKNQTTGIVRIVNIEESASISIHAEENGGKIKENSAIINDSKTNIETIKMLMKRKGVDLIFSELLMVKSPYHDHVNRIIHGMLVTNCDGTQKKQKRSKYGKKGNYRVG